MSDSSSALDYLWLYLREPCLITLQGIVSSKAECRYVESLNTLQHSLRGAVVRFLRGALDYYRDDRIPDLYCRDVWPAFSELYRIIASAQDVGSSTLVAETRAYLFYCKVNESRPDIFQHISKVGQKYLSYVKDFNEKDGVAMYRVRRQTHFIGAACGRIFGFPPYTFRAEKILFNDDKEHNKHLQWLDMYIQWLQMEKEGYLQEFVIPHSEGLAVCGFRGMTNIEEDIFDNGDYYGEFSYRPSWDRKKIRGTRGIDAWFHRHLNNNQMEGVLYTTESVRRRKDLCCFWPIEINEDTAWPEGRFLELSHKYNDIVGSVQDDIWLKPEFKSLIGKDRIAMLELALNFLDTNPWTYLHLANEYRALEEPWIYGDIVRGLYCWPKTLSQYMPRDMFERIEDEYYHEVSEYASSY